MTDYQQNTDDESTDDDSESSKKARGEDDVQSKPVRGLWLLSSTAKVKPLGSVTHLGAPDITEEGNPAVSIVSNSQGNGYWIVYANGKIDPLGAAVGFEGVLIEEGSVTAAGSTSDSGLILALSTGGIKVIGSAEFLGSASDMGLTSPVSDMAIIKGGYWLLTRSGRVINFGETIFLGSASETVEERGVDAVSMASHPKGDGYWIALSDGFVISCGRSIFSGRLEDPQFPVVSIISTHDGNGYWLIDANGGVFPFGEANGFEDFAKNDTEGFGQIVSVTPVF